MRTPLKFGGGTVEGEEGNLVKGEGSRRLAQVVLPHACRKNRQKGRKRKVRQLGDGCWFVTSTVCWWEDDRRMERNEGSNGCFSALVVRRKQWREGESFGGYAAERRTGREKQKSRRVVMGLGVLRL
ncbi:hypothetical protein HAX54_040080 [Datura stramonium]|uniref:Uncharacterized protein n=1 Tax=Datura stramonium TaxID=4076 RepID=A0ABS8SJR3_DATST|nr:hypothetical protein [Datura stramonium]